MVLDETSMKPIFMQIADWIEDEIMKQNFKEESQIPSTNQFAARYRINPATAGKGINVLVEEGILYKKRGIGMFVAAGALERIRTKRVNRFKEEYIIEMLREAKTLSISKEDIIDVIRKTEI